MNQHHFHRPILPASLLCAALLAMLSFASPLYAVGERSQKIELPQHKSRLIELHRMAHKVSVGNPEIADILILRATRLYVLGKKLGSTNVIIWDKDDELITVLDIEITHDLNAIKAKLHQFLPGETIEVHTSQNKLILSGQVSSAEKMAIALQIARTFTGENRTGDKDQSEKDAADDVLNLMTIGGAQQVMLEITVAEVQRSLVRKFDSNFHIMHNSGDWSYGGVGGGATFYDLPDAQGLVTPVFFNNSGSLVGGMMEAIDTPMSIADKGLYASFMNGSTLFNVAFDIAKQNGVAKVLAEPTLTSLSGNKASFISGGEFPIPVPSDDGVTIEYKEFGVGVEFMPTVLDSKRINLDLSILVSEISGQTSVNINPNGSNGVYIVPTLSKRNATTTIELGDGQTIGIAGLLSENLTDVVDKLPGLGDLPLLGQLFRSQEFQKGETELVILVTPHLAKPVDRDSLSLPTDGFVEAEDWSYYLLGRMSQIGEKRDDFRQQQTASPQNDATDAPKSVEGQFGHTL